MAAHRPVSPRFVADLLGFACFFGAGLLLYAVLKPVDPTVALAMVLINAVSVAIQALNMLNHLGALLVATEPGYTSGLSSETSQALVSLFLELHRQGYLIAQIFFWLFLLPLGYLVNKSGYFPKILGPILVIGCAGYLTGAAATYLAPSFAFGLSMYCGLVGGVAELGFLMWILIMGAKSDAASVNSRVLSGVTGAVA